MFQPRRTPVRIPLSPSVLLKLGAFAEFPSVDHSFDPDGDWEQLYSIWTCHGYNEEGNYHDGFLNIKKTGENGHTRINVEKQFVCEEAINHVMKASILCKNEPVSHPLEWEFSSQHLTPEDDVAEYTSFTENGSIKDGYLKIVNGKKASGLKLNNSVLSDWNLFDVVQNLVFSEQSQINFNLLERLELLKENHILGYRGTESFPQEGSSLTLHRFAQTGDGILPFDYWLDESHKLFLAITFSVAYIADDNAVEKFQARKNGQKARYDIRKEQSLNNTRS